MRKYKTLLIAIILLTALSVYLNYLKPGEKVPYKLNSSSPCSLDNSYDNIKVAYRNPDKVCSVRILKQSEFTKDILRFKNLKQLVASSLNYLPPEIGQLSNLEILYLDNNSLTALPEEILNLKKLRELYLGGNKLREIPKKISELINLEILRLEYNELVCLPSQIGSLKNLRDLRVGANKLLMLPPEITKLTNLKTLSVYHNPMVLDQTPQSFLIPRDDEIFREEIETFNNSAKKGQGITHLAREIIEQYLKRINFEETNPLTYKQKICLEDYLQKQTGYEKLYIGETRTFSSLLLKGAFTVCKIKINNICQ